MESLLEFVRYLNLKVNPDKINCEKNSVYPAPVSTRITIWKEG